MPGALHVRNVDDDVIQKLKMRAAANGRSAEAEHRQILKDVLTPKMDRDTWHELAARVRASLAHLPQTPSEILQRESRDERDAAGR